jgi:hypothetical protein
MSAMMNGRTVQNKKAEEMIKRKKSHRMLYELQREPTKAGSPHRNTSTNSYLTPNQANPHDPPFLQPV